jgi:hypothetical protein
LLEQGVISKDNSVKFISPINCVPKKNGTFRLVIDLRKLNSCVETCNFKYEDINSILEYVSPKDKLVTLDIKDGFYHVPISPNSQQYMGFMYKNETFKWCKLPFGLCVSPYFFCTILRPIVAFLRSIGIEISVYVDDILISAFEDLIEKHRDFVLEILQKLGLYVNFQKSDLNPSYSKQYIGYIINTDHDNHVWLKIPKDKSYKTIT